MAKIVKISPMAPQILETIFPISGVKFASTNCGLYKHKDDLMLAVFQPSTTVAGVFTKSTMASAPVIHCRSSLSTGSARALIINSGNSIAVTGQSGFDIAKIVTDSVSQKVSCDSSEVFMASTGVIGSPFEPKIITNRLSYLYENLKENDFTSAATAIMTTDTFMKIASTKTQIFGETIHITGFAKGSGMIEPNMATMLAFIFTDAKIPSNILQDIFSQHNEKSFNAITVDSDTSTSDTALMFATGAAHNKIPTSVKDLEDFSDALLKVMQNLAKQIVMDGEGAQKLIEINVNCAKSDESAKIVAKAIANSPLVKTAIAGSDANWGRIAMAIGKTLEPVNLSRLAIEIGRVKILENGQIVSGYNENHLQNHLLGQKVAIHVSLGVGLGNATVWTCDLTHGYIDINVDYRS